MYHMNKRYPIVNSLEELSLGLDKRTGNLQRVNVTRLKTGDRIIQIGQPDVVVFDKGPYMNKATLRMFGGEIREHTWPSPWPDVIIRRRKVQPIY